MKKIRAFILIVTVTIIFSALLIANENREIKESVGLEIVPVNRFDGTVDFQVRTISYNGAYAPAHCLAIWVCDENDNFIRTLVRRAWPYREHLIKWNEMTNGDYTNALITGASPNVHTTWTFNWDCLDRFGEMIPDGNYKVYVEFTEDNSALIPANGPWTMVEFTKGEQAQTVTPAGDQFFQDLFLDFIPAEYQDPTVEITSPLQGAEITSLPIILLLELENFPQDSGTINLFINNEFTNQYSYTTGITIYELPEGEVELTLKLFNAAGQPYDPPAEDTVNITYNPVSSPENSVNSPVTDLDIFPNPFNPSTEIRFQLSDLRNQEIKIEIYNGKGQKIKTFPVISTEAISGGVERSHSTEYFSLTWHGNDQSGNPVSSGVYLINLKSDGKTLAQKKCLLLK